MTKKDSLRLIGEKAESIARLIKESDTPDMAVVITKKGMSVRDRIEAYQPPERSKG